MFLCLYSFKMFFVLFQKPIKQKGKENKETPAKDKKSASSEKLDTKEAIKPGTPTKHAKAKDGSPSKMQVSFDSSIMSSTDAIENDLLFESIEDQTLPEMDTSASESSAKEGEKAVNLDDSLNKDIEEITDTEVIAGSVEETVPDVVKEKSKSPSPVPDVIPQEKEGDQDEIIKPEPVVASTPAKEPRELSPIPKAPSSPAKEARDVSPAPKAAGTPASTNKSQKELELEEYRAKLAEKRRQAREKAEREAELERQRQEQIRYT